MATGKTRLQASCVVLRVLVMLLAVLVLPAAVLSEDYVMDPAPADRPKFEYRRRPGELKRTEHGLIDPSPDVISLEHLPKDQYGFPDWARALKEGVIAPKDALPGKPSKEEPAFDKDVIIKSKMDFMPDVLFPHSTHNQWLKCSTCHPKIFSMKAGETPISMVAIWKGKYCGRCHDRVAFPTKNCLKCHTVKRQAAP